MLPWEKPRRGSAHRDHRGRGRLGRRQVPGRQGVVQVARRPHLQDARPRLPLALPRLRALHGVQGRAPQRHRANVSRGRSRPRRLARPHRRAGARAAARHRAQRSTRQAREERARVASSLPRCGRASPISRSIGRPARSLAARAQRASLTTALGASLTGTLFVLGRADRRSPRHRRAPPRRRDARPREGRQYGARHRARSRHRRALRSRRGDGPRRGPARRKGPLPGHAGRDRDQRHRHRSRLAQPPQAASRNRVGQGQAGARDHRDPREQPEDRSRQHPARRPLRHHRPERLRQEHARRGHRVSRSRAPLRDCREQARGVRVDEGPREDHQRGAGRSVAARPHGPAEMLQTYTHAWDRVRARFAAESEALRRGLSPAHFSFNVPGKGRCETCAGEATRRSRCSSSPT